MPQGAAARGGWSYQLLTGNLMADPRPQRTLRAELLNGVGQAQLQKQHMGPDFRNFRRSHRTARTRSVVGGPGE